MVYLICGKICSGKTYYARMLSEKHNAVILSTDEVTFDLIDNEQGEFYNTFAARVNRYLRKKAAEISLRGTNVILDWGFWTKADRTEISQYFESQGVPFEWHYMDTPEPTIRRNIDKRNRRIQEGNGGSDFYVDEGLWNKVNTLFEPPREEEMHIVVRGE